MLILSTDSLAVVPCRGQSGHDLAGSCEGGDPVRPADSGVWVCLEMGAMGPEASQDYLPVLSQQIPAAFQLRCHRLVPTMTLAKLPVAAPRYGEAVYTRIPAQNSAAACWSAHVPRGQLCTVNVHLPRITPPRARSASEALKRAAIIFLRLCGQAKRGQSGSRKLGPSLRRHVRTECGVSAANLDRRLIRGQPGSLARVARPRRKNAASRR